MASPDNTVSLPEGHSHINDELQAQLASLAHRHVNVSYTLIGVLVLILTFGGVGAYFAAKWVDRSLARAEKVEELYKQERATADQAVTDLKKQLADSQTAQAAAQKKIEDMQSQISSNNQKAAAQKEEILKPGKTASEAYADAANHYKLTSPLDITQSADKTEQLLAFRIPDVQRFTATKVDLDTANANSVLKDQQLGQKDVQITNLKNDVAKSNDALTKMTAADDKCEIALQDYKKIAKRTKFQKILHGAWTGLKIGGALIAGYELGKKI
jgi:septal ring factor EnvC (AmiA/AmiB activator)